MKSPVLTAVVELATVCDETFFDDEAFCGETFCDKVFAGTAAVTLLTLITVLGWI